MLIGCALRSLLCRPELESQDPGASRLGRGGAQISDHEPGRFLILTVCLVVLLGCVAEETLDQESTSADTDLTALEALPYLSWSEEEADAEKLGVTIWEQERAWSGLNLYTNDVNEAYVMGMGGRRLHSWTLPQKFTHCEHFELLTAGEIVAVCEGQALVRLDRESRVIWELHKQVHHDVAVLDDGTLLVPRGGRLREYKGRQVGFDVLLWVADGGQVVDRWRSWEHLEELRQHHGPSRLDEPR